MTELLSTNDVAAAPKPARSKSGKSLPVEPKSVVWNPPAEEIRRYAEAMPNARITEWGNVNVATRVVSRSKLSTYIATDRPESAAFLQIDELRQGEHNAVISRRVFSGWMFASSPALSALENSIYDVGVLDCRSESTAAPSRRPAGK